MRVRYLTVGIDQLIETEFSISSDSKSLLFNSDAFNFKILLDDSVERDDFISMLRTKAKKMTLGCELQFQDKRYKGERKILWRDENLTVSQGGIRFEFDADSATRICDLLSTLREKLS